MLQRGGVCTNGCAPRLTCAPRCSWQQPGRIPVHSLGATADTNCSMAVLLFRLLFGTVASLIACGMHVAGILPSQRCASCHIYHLGELVAPWWRGRECGMWLHWHAAPLQSVVRGFCGVLEGAGEGVMVGHGLQVRGGAGDWALGVPSVGDLM